MSFWMSTGLERKMPVGIVKTWNGNRGFGFIEVEIGLKVRTTSFIYMRVVIMNKTEYYSILQISSGSS